MKRVLRKGGTVRCHQLAFAFALLFTVDLWAPPNVHAQGPMTYLSNVSQSSVGSRTVGSDSWLAAIIRTGTNSAGYMLDSIQLKLEDASGSPSGFTAMLYDESVSFGGFDPGTSLGTLMGSVDPAASGIYSYTAPPNLTLSAQTHYYLVLKAETTVADGSYNWSRADSYSYNTTGGWGVSSWFLYSLNGGSSWISDLNVYPQFSLTATPIPEPGTLGLVMVGAAFVGARRCRVRPVAGNSR